MDAAAKPLALECLCYTVGSVHTGPHERTIVRVFTAIMRATAELKDAVDRGDWFYDSAVAERHSSHLADMIERGHDVVWDGSTWRARGEVKIDWLIYARDANGTADAWCDPATTVSAGNYDLIKASYELLSKIGRKVEETTAREMKSKRGHYQRDDVSERSFRDPNKVIAALDKMKAIRVEPHFAANDTHNRYHVAA